MFEAVEEDYATFLRLRISLERFGYRLCVYLACSETFKQHVLVFFENWVELELGVQIEYMMQRPDSIGELLRIVEVIAGSLLLLCDALV